MFSCLGRPVLRQLPEALATAHTALATGSLSSARPSVSLPTGVRTLKFVPNGIPRRYENILREAIRPYPKLGRVDTVEVLWVLVLLRILFAN